MNDFEFFNPINKELQIVENCLEYHVGNELPILNEASTHLVKAGGKRLRPAFALLAAKLYSESAAEVIPLATALELIHMATLVHDDVIDDSNLRRGKETVKSAWGNRVSIHTGNYVFARALSLIAGYSRSDILAIIADASMRICEGEIKQMFSCYDINQGLIDYMRRIERKTALLISVSCQLGAMACQAAEAQIQALKKYGYYLGMTFQITDDILDVIADESILGKPVGSDIRQGVITLPAIYALRYGAQKGKLAQVLSSPQLCIDRADEAIDLIIASGGIEYSYQLSCRFAEKACQQLVNLPDVPVRQCLYNIAGFISNREY